MCNGKKTYKVQNYLCKECGRQFIADSDRTYKGTIAWFFGAIKRALVRGCGIRDVAVILEVSIGKVLETFVAAALLERMGYKVLPSAKATTTLSRSKNTILALKSMNFGPLWVQRQTESG